MLEEYFVLSGPALLYHVNVNYIIYESLFVNTIVNFYRFSRDRIHESISAHQISKVESLAACIQLLPPSVLNSVTSQHSGLTE